MPTATRSWFLAALAGFAVGCKASLPATAEAAPVGSQPWTLPPYSAAQEALLKPVGHPIQTPAKRVFPDLSRFVYGNNRPLSHPEESVRLTKLVATVLNESPRFYSLEEAGPDLANDVLQYGPAGPSEPDGWLVPGLGGLVHARADDASKEAFAKGSKKDKENDLAGAAAAYEKAVEESPLVPAIRYALADNLGRQGKSVEAERALQEIVRIDASFAPAHVALAEIAERRHDEAGARHEIAEALAYAPTSARAAAVAIRLGAQRTKLASPTRRDPIPIFLDVDSVGAIHVATSGGSPRQMYAGCRAVVRFEPEVRAKIFEEAEGLPYHLSLGEEVICLEAALGAYIIDRSTGEGEDDDDLDALLAIAHKEGLAGYAMFEIVGQHRPERARGAPPDIHRATVDYVVRHVLAADDDDDTPGDGAYTADRR